MQNTVKRRSNQVFKCRPLAFTQAHQWKIWSPQQMQGNDSSFVREFSAMCSLQQWVLAHDASSSISAFLNFLYHLFGPETVQPLPGNSLMGFIAPQFLNLYKFSIKIYPQYCSTTPYLHFKRRLLSCNAKLAAPAISFKLVSNVRLQISLVTKLPKITKIWSQLTKL